MSLFNNDEIRAECDRFYSEIKNAQNSLEKLREICPHERTHECLYSWRVGSFCQAVVCSDCGEFIRALTDPDSVGKIENM